ncbi:hypothetical protein GH714_024864 [Hevea brasiliensis]|uniref:PGG domain-containing protein n=1 Tax=Hevea brasiliensis TaxID=3981 RepID=A0A6A6MYT9_HEVBR|nr:hypothetical protein GH714_024864 [Hevea brasiliensis]
MRSSNTTNKYIRADSQKAAEEGNLDPLIKEHGSTLDSLETPNKNTILHIYLTSQSERSFKFVKDVLGICSSLLLKVNVNGDTPLHIAARYGHADAAKELIAETSHHSEIDIERGEGPRDGVRKKLRMTNKNKETALHVAARYGRSLGVVEAILSNEDPEYTYSANDCGETPLYRAADNGCEEIVLELLRNPNSKSLNYVGPVVKRHYMRPINYQLRFLILVINYQFGPVDFVPVIIDKLLDKWSSLAKDTDEEGWIPLHYAAYKNRTSVVRKLLERDESSAYVADKHWKRTALHIAACRGFIDTMEEIISKCPNCCELTDIRGWNVLHYAVISKKNEIIKAVLKHSSLFYLLDEKDVKGNTPVHLYRTYHPDYDHLPSFIKGEDTDISKCWKKLHKEVQFSGNLFLKKNDNLKWMKDLGGGPLGKMVRKSKEEKEEQEERRKKNMVLNFEKVKDSHLVAATLIATVTFAAGFTLPGGNISGENDLKKGSPILGKNLAFKAFMISDTIAMVLSTCSVFIHLMLVVVGYLKRYYWLIRCAFSFLFYAMVAMVITFVTGTYAVLTPSFRIVICVVGLSFFFLFYFMIRVSGNLISLDDDDDDKDNGDGITSKDQAEILSWVTGGISSLLSFIRIPHLIKKIKDLLKNESSASCMERTSLKAKATTMAKVPTDFLIVHHMAKQWKYLLGVQTVAGISSLLGKEQSPLLIHVPYQIQLFF